MTELAIAKQHKSSVMSRLTLLITWSKRVKRCITFFLKVDEPTKTTLTRGEVQVGEADKHT